MNFWFGKLFGGLLGLLSGGPFGLLVGAFAGHILDQSLGSVLSPDANNTDLSGQTRHISIQRVFFRTTFRVMGRLAKADGRVSPQEIDAASHVMDQMGLAGTQRQSAIDCFNEGKQADFDLYPDFRQLKLVFAQRSSLAQMFFEIQLSVAYADGVLSKEERLFFNDLCRELGVSTLQFEWIHGRIKAARGGQSKTAHDQHQHLRNAYAVLGVKSDVSMDEVKKAYRKLMSQHHPDKLLAKGLPEEMMKLAKEKTQDIQTAYDVIRRSRS